MLRSVYQKFKETCQFDYTKFCSLVKIPCFGSQIRPFSEVAEPWQWEDVKVFQSVFAHLWGDHTSPWRNVWLTRPRGHDKTSSIARLVTWAILFERPNTPRFNIYISAVDKDQANLLLDSLEEFARINFPKLVKVKAKGVAESFGGRVVVLSSDASSSYGLRANVLVLDELTHWVTPKSKRFFDALWSGKSKVRDCVCIVLTNSGYINTWQHELLKSLETSKDWYVYNKPGRLAKWHGNVGDVEMGLTDSEKRRLLYNEWVENESVNLYELFVSLVCSPEQVPQPSECDRVIIGVDYASTFDVTAICELFIKDGVCYVKNIHAGHWDPIELEDLIFSLWKTYVSVSPVELVFDRYQMEYIHYKLSRNGVPSVLVRPTSDYNKKALSNLLSLMRSRRLWFPDPFAGEYRGETLDTEMKHIKLDLPRGRADAVRGRDDRFHALMYCVQRGVDLGLLKGDPYPLYMCLPDKLVDTYSDQPPLLGGANQESPVLQPIGQGTLPPLFPPPDTPTIFAGGVPHTETVFGGTSYARTTRKNILPFVQ